MNKNISIRIPIVIIPLLKSKLLKISYNQSDRMVVISSAYLQNMPRSCCAENRLSEGCARLSDLSGDASPSPHIGFAF